MDKILKLAIYLLKTEVKLKEQDLHELIQKNSSYDNKSLANALKQLHPEIFQNSISNKDVSSKSRIKKRIAIFAPLATAGVLAVVLIPTLLLNGGSTGAPGNEYTPPPIKYTISELDCTVQEYNELYNTKLLYLNWIDTTDYSVIKYSSVDNDEFLGLSVRLKKTDANDYIEYVISSDSDKLIFLKQTIIICNNESSVLNYTVKWVVQNNNSYGIFEFDGYSYYVTLKENTDETKLFEYIEELLLSQS